MNYKTKVIFGASFQIESKMNAFFRDNAWIIVQKMTQSSLVDTSGDYPETLTIITILYTEETWNE